MTGITCKNKNLFNTIGMFSSFSALLYNYGLNISRLSIASGLIIKFFTFGYYAFNLNCMLLLELGDSERCPNTEFFLVRIFLYSDLTRRFIP